MTAARLQQRLDRWQDRLGTAIHKVHGTRGILWISLALVLMSILEPLLPRAAPPAVWTVPLFVLLMTAAVTLPREAVAFQDRILHVARQGAAGSSKTLWRRSAWPAVLLVALAPQLFLAAYGIPGISPLAGLLHPSITARIGAGYMFGLLALAAWSLRRSKRHASHIRSSPLASMDAAHRSRRDTLWWLTLAIMAVWLVFLAPFWRPFSLFAIPPGFGSFTGGVAGLAAVIYVVGIPALALAGLSADIHAAIRIRQEHGKNDRAAKAVLAALGLHAALWLAVAALHIYDLLWIARFESLSQF